MTINDDQPGRTSDFPNSKLSIMIGGYLVFAILMLAAVLMLIHDRPAERSPHPREQGVPR
jgi:hypothetical protein